MRSVRQTRTIVIFLIRQRIFFTKIEASLGCAGTAMKGTFFCGRGLHISGECASVYINLNMTAVPCNTFLVLVVVHVPDGSYLFFRHKCDLRLVRQQRAEDTLKAARILTPYVQPPQIGCQRFNRLRKGSHSNPSINTSTPLKGTQKTRESSVRNDGLDSDIRTMSVVPK